MTILLTLIALVVAIPAITAVRDSRFSCLVADALCLVAVATLILLPISVSSELFRTNSFYREYERLFFFLPALGCPLLLFLAGLFRVDQDDSRSAMKATWVSFWLAVVLIWGFYLIIFVTGYGGGA